VKPPTRLIAAFADSATVTQVSIVEKIFDLKPDEKALLKRISATNLKAEGINAFIYKQMGNSEDFEGQDE